MQRSPSQRRDRVFLSYSRSERAESQRLRDRLIADGLDAYLDLHDIAKGEPWQQRLHNLIASADAVLFLISPRSVASEYCDWELNEAERLAKRVFPVLVAATPLDAIPRRLARLHFTRLDDPDVQEAEYALLLEALRADANWVREHTRLLELAVRWDVHGRSRARLLRGKELEASEAWRDSRTPTAPELTPLHTDFLRQSRGYAVMLLRAGVIGLTGLIVLVGGLALFALVQRDEAVAQRSEAESRELVLLSDAARPATPEQALVHALAAYDKRPSQAAVSALRRSIDRTMLVLRRQFRGGPSSDTGLPTSWARSSDGLFIVVVKKPGWLSVLDARTLGELRQLSLSTDLPAALAISRQGHRVAAADADGKVTIWTKAEAEAPKALVLQHPVSDLAFSPSGRRLAAVGRDSVSFVDFDATAAAVTVKYDVMSAAQLAFSPDEAWVAAIGRDNEAWVLSPDTGKQRSRFDLRAQAETLKPKLGGSDASLLDRPYWVPSADRLLVTGSHLPWTVWDPARGLELARASTAIQGSGAGWALFDSGGQRVIANDGSSGRIVAWDLSRGRTSLRFEPGHRDLIRAADLDEEAGLLMTVGGDRTLALWDTASAVRLGSWALGDDEVLHAAIVPGARRIVLQSRTGALSVLHGDSVFASPPLAMKGFDLERSFYEPHFSDDGKHLLSFGSNAPTAVWNLDTRQPVCTTLRDGRFVPAQHAAIDRGARRLAEAGSDGTVRAFEIGTCKELWRVSFTAQHVAFSHDGTTIAANDFEGSVRLFSAATGRQLATARVEQGLTNACTFTADGTRLAVMGNDGTAIILNTATAHEVSRVSMPGLPFRRAAFTSDGRTLVTTHDDNIVRSWNVADGRLVSRLAGAAGLVTRVRLVAEDRLVLAASADGSARLWDLADGTLLRSFDGVSRAAGDAIAMDDWVTMVDTDGRTSTYRCTACLPESALVSSARSRVAGWASP